MKLPFCKRYSIDTTINEEKVTFYSSSLSMLYRLKAVSEPILQAVVTVMDSQQDRGLEKRQVFAMEDGAADNFGTSEVILHAIDPQLAKMRASEKRSAITQLIGLLDRGNTIFMAEVILDSLKSDETPENFIKECDIPTLVECLLGVWKANTAKHGPLAEGALKKIKDLLKAQMSGTQVSLQTEEDSQEVAEADSKKEESDASQTSGNGSKTQLYMFGEGQAQTPSSSANLTSALSSPHSSL